LAKMNECNSYPCWEVHNLSWRIDRNKLRRRHSTHGVIATAEPFVNGLSLVGPGDNIFRSLIHKGRKRRK
jgi:hypothetical protein